MKDAMALTMHVLRENWPLLAIPAGAAVVGYLLGRLLRGHGRK